MFAHERQARIPIRKRVLDAPADHAIDRAFDVIRELPRDDDPAERNGRAGLALPEFSKIDDFAQALRLIGEAVLVNDESGVESAGEERRLDIREYELGLVRRAWKREAEKKVRGRE